MPWEVVEYLAARLGIEGTSCVKRYPERRRTPYKHAEESKERFKNRVPLPGVSVPDRQVSEARTAAERRLFDAVARAAHRSDPPLASALAQLLVVPEGKRVSELERLRTPPVKTTGTAMVLAMEQGEEVSACALRRVNLSRVPVNRLYTPARYGQLSKAQTIVRASEPRRTALLTAVVRQLEAQAVDDTLDLFAVLMANRLINPVRRASDREWPAMPHQLPGPLPVQHQGQWPRSGPAPLS